MSKKIKIFSFIILFFAVLLTMAAGLLIFKNSQSQTVSNPLSATPKTLELTKELKKVNFSLESVPFETKGSIVAVVSGSKVIFSTKKSLKAQVKALQLTLPSLKIDTVKPREVDLRFDKVVIRY